MSPTKKKKKTLEAYLEPSRKTTMELSADNNFTK